MKLIVRFDIDSNLAQQLGGKEVLASLFNMVAQEFNQFRLKQTVNYDTYAVFEDFETEYTEAQLQEFFQGYRYFIAEKNARYQSYVAENDPAENIVPQNLLSAEAKRSTTYTIVTHFGLKPV